MTFKSLIQSNIFPIPVGSYYNLQPNALYLVYSPLAHVMLIATPDSVRDLESAISEPEKAIPQIKEAIEQLINHVPINKKIRKIRGTDDLQKMSILPNHICNLSCTYCYSSQGRTNMVLNKTKLKTALEYFINPARLENRFLSISFIGGGEPLLSWDIVKYGIEYAAELATKGGFTLGMTLITNGTIMNEEILSVLKKYNVLPDISFDILNEFQEKERGQYEKVCNTLDMLAANNLKPSVNATITPSNVCFQEHMLQEIISRFNFVDNMIFEPVVDAKLFQTVESFKKFYNDYRVYFTKVRKLGEKYGKKIESRLSRNLNDIIDRGCPSKFTVTPQGDLTICYCSSSPKETHYERRVFGKIKNDLSISLNQKKFLSIHNENVYSFSKCSDCFAKWHCGGGCMCPNDTYSSAYLDVICDFTRDYVKQALLERMDAEGIMSDFLQKLN
ncbi:MAG: radical SAM protein [Bacteroidales bacterium]|nr:radical SAM protein [Bacteroidales bacterium]